MFGAQPSMAELLAARHLRLNKLLSHKRETQSPQSMHVFESAASASVDGGDGGGGGAAASVSAVGIPPFSFDASFLPAVIVGETGGFDFNAPAARELAEATGDGEAGDKTPLLGSTFQSKQVVVGAGGATKTEREEETVDDGEQLVSGLHMGSFFSEEQLMNSGLELHERYTCPLCCLPMALPMKRHSKFMPCCMKIVCDGCILASRRQGIGNTCPFCRTPAPDSEADIIALVQKRADAKDPVAIEFLASAFYDGSYGLQQDVTMAIELWTEAARLGNLDAHYTFGYSYCNGKDVQQDVARGICHYQHSAIEGHPYSRHNLGYQEYLSGNQELAVQHLMISAKMGYEESLTRFKDMFMKGLAKKAQYAEALRGYQDAVEETKSPQREEAKAFYDGTK